MARTLGKHPYGVPFRYHPPSSLRRSNCIGDRVGPGRRLLLSLLLFQSGVTGGWGRTKKKGEVKENPPRFRQLPASPREKRLWSGRQSVIALRQVSQKHLLLLARFPPSKRWKLVEDKRYLFRATLLSCPAVIFGSGSKHFFAVELVSLVWQY